MYDEKPKDFLSPLQLLKDRCCPFSRSSLYWHIAKSETNGLAPAIYRIGKKVIISRSEFIKWIVSHQAKDRRDENNSINNLESIIKNNLK